MTRPDSGSEPPPPPPRLSRPIVTFDRQPALEIESELRGVSGRTGTHSVSVRGDSSCQICLFRQLVVGGVRCR